VLKKTKEENVNQKLNSVCRFAQENYPMEEKLSYKNIHNLLEYEATAILTNYKNNITKLHLFKSLTVTCSNH